MKNGFLYLLFSRTNSWLLAQTDETHVTLKPPSHALLEILYRLICQSCKRQTVLKSVFFIKKIFSNMYILQNPILKVESRVGIGEKLLLL